MTHTKFQERRVLARHPTSRGFGFVILEGPANLADWGVRAARRDQLRETLAKLSVLIDLTARFIDGEV
jgi:hypothetical protein